MKMENIEVLASEIPDKELTPEQCLLVAIFERALRDYLTPSVDVARAHQRSARIYFSSTSMEYGSFLHFCEYLEMDSKSILRIVYSGDIPLLRKKHGRQKVSTVKQKRS